jgi:hypothetical protein
MNDRRIILNCIAIAMVAICLIVDVTELAADELPKWTLMNGDFSTYQGWAQPAGWSLAIEAGKHTVTVDPVPRQPTQPPSLAAVSSQVTGQGYLRQTVRLLDGAWRLHVEVSGSKGARAQLEVSRSVSRQSKQVAVISRWQRLTLSIPRAGGDTGIHPRLYSPAGGTVKFRRVRLDVVRLKSEPVPIEGGGVLGGLVLATKPTPAERFAACELQRFVHQMTGKTLGIKGRDEVFDGYRINICGATTPAVIDKLKGRPTDAYAPTDKIDRASD